MTAEMPERLAIREMLLLLKPYLAAYVASELGTHQTAGERDTPALMQQIIGNWEGHFAGKLPKVVRTYLFELKDIRNRWAHEETFTAGDVCRAAETTALVAEAIGVGHEQVDAIRALAMGPAAAGRRESSRVTRKEPSQRDVMKAIFARCGDDRDRVVREYADAERRGEVARRRNAKGLDPETYARALLGDGLKKGWLP